MSRNLLLLAGGIIIVLVIAGFFYMPAQQNGFSFGLGVTGEDENGDPVTLPFAFVIQGVEVTNIRCVATWTANGDGLEWSTLAIVGEFRINRLDYQGQNPTDITPFNLQFTRTGESNKDGTTYFSIPCDQIINGVSRSGVDQTGDYWNIQVTLSVSGFVEQIGDYGEDLSDSFTDHLEFTLRWIDGSFTLGGGLTR